MIRVRVPQVRYTYLKPTTIKLGLEYTLVNKDFIEITYRGLMLLTVYQVKWVDIFQDSFISDHITKRVGKILLLRTKFKINELRGFYES